MRLAGLAALALVLAVAGCGGASSTQSTQTQKAAIPSSIADQLVEQSEAVAATWTADPCSAAKEADDLKHAVDDAIASGEIPADYEDELEAAALNLQNTANCVEDQAGEDEGDDHDHGHGPGKGKGHGKHDEDEGTVTTDTLGTTSEDEG
jgi:hypothetical protein